MLNNLTYEQKCDIEVAQVDIQRKLFNSVYDITPSSLNNLLNIIQSLDSELTSCKDFISTNQRIHDAIEIAANLSKDVKDDESAVDWVQRVIKERDDALEKVEDLVYEIKELGEIN
jgi:hypothetical protein